jgi:hypothetical protein
MLRRGKLNTECDKEGLPPGRRKMDEANCLRREGTPSPIHTSHPAGNYSRNLLAARRTAPVIHDLFALVRRSPFRFRRIPPGIEDCRRSHTGIFVWTCLNIDFTKRLNFLKERRADLAGANASAASRINCDCVARLTMRCRSHSASAVLLRARCLSTSVARCSAFKCDPHFIACSVLTKVGMTRFLTR